MSSTDMATPGMSGSDPATATDSGTAKKKARRPR
jgi:hypothetical protein